MTTTPPSNDSNGTPPPYQPPAEQPQGWEPAGTSDGSSGTEQPVPPARVLTAVKLMYVGAAISVVGLVFMLLGIDSLRDQIKDEDSSLSASEVDSAVNFAITVSVIVGVIAIGLWLWMAAANKRGKAWARTVSAVLAGLGLVANFIGLTPTAGFGLGISLLVTVALAGTILWMLYRRESTEYYNAVTRARTGS